MPAIQPMFTGPERHCARAPSPPNPHHPRPWRRGSQFGEGPRRLLTEEQRRTWSARAELEHGAGRLTRAQRDVALALLRHLGADGQCDPSYAALAETAKTRVRSVGRALKPLAALGLIRWERRLVRKAWPAGGPGATRAEQTSNAYELLLPETPVAPPQPRPKRRANKDEQPQFRSRPNCDGQNGREIPLQYSLEAQLAAFPRLDDAERHRLDVIQTARRAKRDEDWHRQRRERWQIGKSTRS